MWSFFVYIITLISANYVLCEPPVFNKCCLENQILVKITERNKTSLFQCKSIESIKLEYEISTSPLILTKDIETSYGMPLQCNEDEIEEYKIDRTVELRYENNECYEILVLETQGGKLIDKVPRIVLLKCKFNITKNTSNYILNIDRIKKCCPEKQAYDVVNKVCTNINDRINEKWLVNEIKNCGPRIFEINTGIRCEKGQYTIDLMSDEFSLDVHGSNLYAFSKTMAKELRIREGDWCMDRRKDNSELVSRVCTNTPLAFGAHPIKKCCPVGEHYKVRRCFSLSSYCVPNTDDEFRFNMSIYLDPLKKKNDAFPDLLGVRSFLSCPEGKFVVDKRKEENSLNLDGTLQLRRGKEDNYCLEEFDRRHCHDDSPIVAAAIACFTTYTHETKNFRLSFVLNTISAVFLALTMLVYILLPELRTLHGRIVICHTGTMLLGFSFLARVQYGMVENHLSCIVFGYIIYFGFVAAFAWLNVMCVDIWRSFGNVRTVHPLRTSRQDWRRFLWYSLYAWGMAIVMTLIMFLLDKYPIAAILDADIGREYCWFSPQYDSDWPHYIFFVIPMGLLSCANFVLWVLTARYCARVKSELQRLQTAGEDRAESRFHVDKDKHVLTGKLFVVMGAGWLTEFLATMFKYPVWLWRTVACFNQLQGLFLFIILIMKPKYYYMIRKRLNKDYSQAQPLQSHRGTKRPVLGLESVPTATISTTVSSEEPTGQWKYLPS